MALDAHQQAIVDEVSRAVGCVEKRKNMLIIGEAGTGKSYLLRKLRECADGMDIAMVCPTGVAAENLKSMLRQKKPVPMTVHSYFMVQDRRPVQESVRMLREKHAKRVAQICSPHFLLIIDELPMLSCLIMDKVQRILRILRGDEVASFRSRPWGGAWVIMCGDCFQIPPIETVDALRCMRRVPAFFFLHEEWAHMVDKVEILTQIHRQDDPAFIHFLSEIRRRLPGTPLSRESQSFLHQLSIRSFQGLASRQEKEKKEGISRRHLCPTREEAREINQRHIQWLWDQGRETRKWPVRVVKRPEEDVHLRELGERIAKRTGYHDVKGTLLEYLVEGSTVRFTENIAPGGGVANGTVGEVVGFDDAGGPWEDEKLLLSKIRQRAPAEESRGLGFPVVRVESGSGAFHVLAAPHPIREVVYSPAGRVEATLTAEVIPLVPGMASTFHSSQGMTLTDGVISFENCFAHGMGYVAFSRFKNHPLVFRCQPDSLTCCPLVENFYRRLEAGDPAHGAIALSSVTLDMLGEHEEEEEEEEDEPPLKRLKK